MDTPKQPAPQPPVKKYTPPPRSLTGLLANQSANVMYTATSTAAAAGVTAGVRQGVPPPSRKVSLSTLIKQRTTRQLFLIDDLIPAHNVCLFIGEDGIGKTNIMAQLCLDNAFGHELYLQHFKLNVTTGRSLYVATEDSAQRFRSAVQNQIVSMYPNINLDTEVPDGFDFLDASDYLDWDEFVGGMDTEIPDAHYDFIIVDSLSDLFTFVDGEINSNTHARRILSQMQTWCGRKKTTIIVLHHAAKTKIVAKRKENKLFVEKNDSQGAGAITQKPRTVLALTNDSGSTSEDGGEYVNFLHVVKANLMGKDYMKNAVALRFTGKSCLHAYLDKIPIDAYQGQEDSQAKLEALRTVSTSGQQRLVLPNEIGLDDHLLRITRIFSKSEEYNIDDLNMQLEAEYGWSKKRINTELRPYLRDKGLIDFAAGTNLWRNGGTAPF